LEEMRKTVALLLQPPCALTSRVYADVLAAKGFNWLTAFGPYPSASDFFSAIA
jgi:hypothetical protein